MKTFEEIVNYAKKHGFVYQGSEIYGGLANTWDYGNVGSLLKNNIKNAWLLKFQKQTTTNVLVDSSILLNPQVWQASGHVGGFSDPLIECKSCNLRFRADKLVLEHDGTDVDGWDKERIENYIKDQNIKCPNCSKHDFAPIRYFNLMFQTHQGVILEQANQIYLRPENAQGMFINFKNVLRTTRKKLPFGICQIGKAFRNEITPGNFIFRTREFEQMELEFFCKPGDEIKWFEHYKKYCMTFLTDLGIKRENLMYQDHSEEQLSHYSNATTDIMYKYPWGFDELWGIASRTDFDLNAHQEASGENMSYLDPETNERYIPYVVEPSVGVERLFLSFLADALVDEELENGSSRELLKIHPYLAPYKAAILPLIRREHSEKAEEIYKELSYHFDVVYDETQNIGRRYRRQDAIGTPLCITVDHDTMTDNTVTIRNRDTMEQIRIDIKDLVKYINDFVKF